MDYRLLAQEALTHCKEIALFTDEPGAITRTFLSEAARSCHAYLSKWIDGIGMKAELDAVGNLRALYAGQLSPGKRLIIGSHLDTVPNAGPYDGVLGVVIGLALVECLRGERLPFAIEVIGFSEEEGVRFGFPFIGSRALSGTLDEKALEVSDAAGVNIRQAIYEFGLDASQLHRAIMDPTAGAYLEFHIEQGPVLDRLNLPLGVATAVIGQSRALTKFCGKANHAGTTPMDLRQDALCAAAEWITCVEKQGRTTEGLVATVGRIEVRPGATNIVPGEVSATLDVRHFSDDVRRLAIQKLLRTGEAIAQRRGIRFAYKAFLDQDTVQMDDELTRMADQAIQATGVVPHRMASGAGHDAMILAHKLPSALIFLRSPGGISHHPDESVLEEDVAAALHAGSLLLRNLSTCRFLT